MHTVNAKNYIQCLLYTADARNQNSSFHVFITDMEDGNVMDDQSLLPQDEADVMNYSAYQIADAFVNQYYLVMKKCPEEAYNFYKDQSIRSHPCADGSMKSVTTRQDIGDEIMASHVKEWNSDVIIMHAQDSVMESVIAGVTGSLIDNDDVTRNFAQTFLLAPQEGGGFYLHNDILQYIEIKEDLETSPAVTDVVDPLPPQQADVADPLPAQQVDVAYPLPVQQADDIANNTSLETEQAADKDQNEDATSAKDTSHETVQAVNKDQTENPTSAKEDVDTETKVSESLKGTNPLPTEPEEKSEPSAWQPAPNVEDAKKVSYASILAKEASVPSFTQLSLNAVGKGSPEVKKRANTSPVPNNGPSEIIYDAKSIRVKDLPAKVTPESLQEALKLFGQAKLKNIQIKAYSQDSYRYAFVEFDNPKSARAAVEARFIRLDGKACEIQSKKVANQGGHNNMGKQAYGRGGFKNENIGRDGEGSSSGNWGHKHNDQGNFIQHFGQPRDYNQKSYRHFQDRK
ncbi:hypothetical protein QVD17_35502 [Tagetes erecta]|uniref:Uncharacterized protein n=1 Tax=Tagetes erecta TaxID=13708 RepID=A0AAD8JZL2_TARER|nr:hypothetical protein QVD17_35502 [Tagetes erecta]